MKAPKFPSYDEAVIKKKSNKTLCCFITLLILRILEKKTKRKYSTTKMVESIRKANVVLLDMNNYKAVYYDEILAHIDSCVGTCLNKKHPTLEEIKTLKSETK